MTSFRYVLITLTNMLLVLFGYLLCLIRPHAEKRLMHWIRTPNTSPTPSTIRAISKHIKKGDEHHGWKTESWDKT